MLKTFSSLAALFCLTVVTYAQPRVSLVTRPLRFEPNQGQDASSAQFLAPGPGYLVQLTPNQLAFKLSPTQTVKLDLLNSRAGARLEGDTLLPGKSNYFPNSDRAQWHSNIPTYERVSEHDTYPGIDLAYYGNQNCLEYDFVLKPHADANQIRLRLAGSDQVRLDSEGNLVIKVGARQASLLKPVVYQTTNGGKSREAVDASYRFEAGLLSFRLGTYDHSRPLVIDPVLQYSEYLYEQVIAVSIDTAGNTYLLTYPEYSQSSLTVTKINPANATVFSSTFGSGLSGAGLALDKSGRAYVTGTASSQSTLPTKPNSYNANSTANGQAAFFLQLSSDGLTVPYATYLGGAADSSTTQAHGIAVDSAGMVYLAGSTASTTFPTTQGVYQTTNTVNTTSGFVAKFDPSLAGKASLVYSTLVVPSTSNYPGLSFNAIAVDLAGDAYLVGAATSGYPVTANAFKYTGLNSNNGGVYVTRLSSTAANLVYSAYLGAGTGTAIAVDKRANAYVTGSVSTEDFPTTPGAYEVANPGGFVVKLDPTGATEIYSTFIGGPNTNPENDEVDGYVSPTALALTPNCPATVPTVITCKVYVTGVVQNTDLPLINAIQNTPSSSSSYPPSYSAFVVEISDSGQSALLSTYLSGVQTGVASMNAPSSAPALAVDLAGNIVVAGNLSAAEYGTPVDFPVTTAYGSSANDQGFVARISPSPGAETLALPSSVAFGPQPIGVSTSIAGTTSKVRLSNFGSSPAAIAGIQVSPAAFSQTNDCGMNIPAGGYCTLSIDFTAGSAALTAGVITVTSNANNSPVTIPLSGSGRTESFLQPSVSSLTFGTQIVGTSAHVQTFTLTNIGNAAATPNLIFLDSTHVDFSQGNNCQPQVLPGSSCSVTVAFYPLAAGAVIGRLEISDPASLSNAVVQLSGSGSITGPTQTASVVPSSLFFAPIALGLANTYGQSVVIKNTSAQPLAIQPPTATGDFSVSYDGCSQYPLNPENSCQIGVTFTPTATGTRTGTLTISGPFVGSPQLVPLTGSGLASTANVEIFPSTSVSAQDQPVGTTGPDQTITLENTGTSPLAFYRVLVSGNFLISKDGCSGQVVNGTNNDGSGTYFTCQVTVNFVPGTTGLQTGTLTFYDSAAGSPQVVNLSGTGIAATGSLLLAQTSAVFAAQAVGTTTSYYQSQTVYFENPGDSPIKILSCNATGDFSGPVNAGYNFPYLLNPGDIGLCNVQFSPTAAGFRTGTLTIHSSAGSQAVSLSGTGVAAIQAVQIIPGYSMDFGSQILGQSGQAQIAYAQIAGSGPVTVSSYSITGPNAQDFTLSSSCLGTQQPGANCTLTVQFSPSAIGARTAIVILLDSAGSGKQVLNLTGQGVAKLPAATLSTYDLIFQPTIQGTSGYGNNPVTFYNNAAFPISLGNVTTSNGFVVLHGYYDSCSGQTIAVGANCTVSLEFTPPVTSSTSGTLISGYATFAFANGNTLIRLPLVGYSLGPVYSAQLNTPILKFPQSIAIGSSSAQNSVVLTNTGSSPINVGAVTGTNLGAVGSGAPFVLVPANLGGDTCSNATLQAGYNCYVPFTFNPTALGLITGTLTLPVTYANNTTATLTATLNGTGVAAQGNAFLSPASITFPDQSVGSSSTGSPVFVLNTGNESFTVGTASSASGEFSLTNSTFPSSQLFFCGSQVVGSGSGCQLTVVFTPSATGTRTGSITVPLTYADGHTSSLKLTLSGNAVAGIPQLLISPTTLTFSPAVQGTSNGSSATLHITNIGNTPVTIGKDTISANSAEFQLGSDSCSSQKLAVAAECDVTVNFNPSSTATGIQTGALTIMDSATVNAQIITLSGAAIAASQQVQLSQTNLNFGSQTAGTTSASQTIYVSNVTSSNVNVSSVVLGGTNAADFQINSYCYYFEDGSCTISVTFAPQPGASGTRTATITETDSAPGSPRTITLSGIAQ